jgi:hypothetical protein
MKLGLRTGLAIAAVLVAVTGGVAYATIPAADGVIHGCYSNRDGKLRVVDTEAGQGCVDRETALDWNQQGPPGPPGPSDTYFVGNQSASLTVGGSAIVARLALPAGKYLLTASFRVRGNDPAQPTFVRCDLTWTEVYAGKNVEVGYPSAEWEFVSDVSVADLAAPGEVTLRCSAYDAAASIDQANFAAIKVGSINGH